MTKPLNSNSKIISLSNELSWRIMELYFKIKLMCAYVDAKLESKWQEEELEDQDSSSWNLEVIRRSNAVANQESVEVEQL